MTIVVERINRSGQVLQSQVFEDRTSITVGRGFDCDVIVHDPHVDREHVRLTLAPDSQQFTCHDLDTINGIWLLNSNVRGISFKHKRKISGKSHFFSGQTFALGRTLLRVYSSHHAIAPAVPVSVWEEVAHSLSHWWVYMGLAVLLIAVSSYDSYLSAPQSKELYKYVLNSSYVVLGALVYAGFWAFIGRNLRHEAKFAAHFSLALGALLLLKLYEFIQPVVIYNLGLWSISGLIMEVLTAGVLFVLGYITLIFACHFHTLARVSIAAIAPVALLIQLLVSVLTQSEYNPIPGYDRSLVGPPWQFRQAVPVEQFVRSSNDLYRGAQLKLIETDNEDEGNDSEELGEAIGGAEQGNESLHR